MNCAMISSQHSLLPRIQKCIFRNKLKRGLSVSRLTYKTRREVNKKKYLITEARKLMQIQTPCADYHEDIYLENDDLDELSLHEEPLDKVDITTHKNSIVIDSPIRKNNLEMELDNELDIVDE